MALVLAGGRPVRLLARGLGPRRGARPVAAHARRRPRRARRPRSILRSPAATGWSRATRASRRSSARDGRVDVREPGHRREPLLTGASWRAPGAGRLRRPRLGAGLRRARAPARAARADAGSWSSGRRARTATRRSRSLGSVLLIGGPIALLLAALAGYGLATAALRPVDADARARPREISRLGSGRRLPVPPGGDELAELGRHAQRDARPPRALGRARARLRGEREPRAAHAAGAAQGRARAGAARGALRPRSCARPWPPRPSESDRLVSSPRTCSCWRAPTRAGCPVRPERLDAAELLDDGRAPLRGARGRGGRELRVRGAGRARAPRRPPARRAGARQPRGQRPAPRRRPVELVAEPAGDGVRLHVLDRGPGFDPALDGRAFERFTRGDRARSRGGTGLGLAIVDAIARSHGAPRGRRDARGRRRGRLDRAARLSLSSHSGVLELTP